MVSRSKKEDDEIFRRLPWYIVPLYKRACDNLDKNLRDNLCNWSLTFGCFK